MLFRKLLFAQFFVLATVASLYIVGMLLYLNWTFWWYDIVLHLLGGVWVALAVSTVLVRFARQPTLVHCILGIAVVGVLWELFEVAVGMPREANYALDTSIDLLMDVLGSIMGFLFIRRTVPSEMRGTITPHDQ